MATTNNPEMNGGFFIGANEVLKELVKIGGDLERAQAEAHGLVEIHGRPHLWDSENKFYYPVPIPEVEDPPFPSPYVFFTLDGIVDYIRENVEGMIPPAASNERLILHVVDHHTVRLMTPPTPNECKRNVIAMCEAHVPRITFESYMDTERFNTMLLSNFIETEARESLFSVVKSMTKEQGCTTSDDGVSQVITVRQGVSSASNVVFQNPVPLKPMRTFTEVEQPESNFTLRVNEDAKCALFEADGGAWKNVAVQRIKDYLKTQLYGTNVVVIA